MDLRLLRSFVVVADELHVHRAAAILHVAQPTLSRQVAALERSVGTALFTRDRRRMALTPAGELLRRGAVDLLQRSDELARDVERAGRGETGTLRLGFVQSATFEALPTLVRAFRAAYMDVVIDATTMTSLGQQDALASGQLDVGLLRPQDPPAGVSCRVISRDPLLAVLPSDHDLAAGGQLALRDLADEPFVFYSRPEGPAVHDAIVACCRSAGFEPRVVQAARDVQTLAALVASGLGVSLVIAPPPPDHGGRVVYRHLDDDTPTWDLAIAWPDGNAAPALRNLLELAADILPSAA
jgi:DNA-binding transcriptional LysR family regulator